MTGELAQLGLGGAVALLLVREAFRFVREHRHGNGKTVTAGQQTPEYWQAYFRATMVDTQREVVEPILRQLSDNQIRQTATIERIADTQDALREGMTKLLERSRAAGA